MTRRVLCAALAAFLGALAAPASAQSVVVSQVYGGGGNAGSTYRQDFIELFNPTGNPVDLTGWSVQYASATGTSWQVTNLSGTIGAGKYYLVRQAQGTGGTTDLPTPDATGIIPMSGTAGKVALMSSTTALSGSCPGGWVDLVGFGATANSFEGTSPTPAPSNTVSVVRADNGCTDTHQNGADFAQSANPPLPRNSTIAANPCVVPLTLNIGNETIGEGDSGTSTLTFTVSLNAPAPANVTFDITTADDTAMAPGDYATSSATGVTIGTGASSVTFDVAIQGDTVDEESETFFVNVTNVNGALTGDTQATGTIQNDDVPLSAIHEIQGTTGTSPLADQEVKVQGIVTAVRTGSFFIQEPEATVDADLETSEGLLVFSAPVTSPGGDPIAVGDLVEVTGTVKEFVPTQDLASPSITEITPVGSKLILSSGHELPPAVTLTAEITLDAERGLDVLERFEGMRVHVVSATVVGPTLGGTLNENLNTQPSSGVFYAVVTGVPRPTREPGVAVPNVLPAGAPANVPRFDGNPERLRVDSDAQPGAEIIDGNAGDLVLGMVGVLDYGFRTYTIYPDPGTAIHSPVRTGFTAAPAPSASQFTIAGFNVQRLYDTVNDPATSDVVVDATAYANRLVKFSQAIRLALHNPDVVAIQEAENLGVLDDLAWRIAQDGGAVYTPYLVEGNDVSGIDNGFLVRSSIQGVIVTQQLDAETYLNPASGDQEILHDRPPLQLAIPLVDGGTLIVLSNHHRSLGGVESTVVDPTDNLATEGERVRAKRKAQAESLANHIQSLQQPRPVPRIVLVGDFNAFEFNDGLVDVIGTILGKPAPADEVVAASEDIVKPDFIHLGQTTVPVMDMDSYSYNFDGNTQSLDHAMVSASTLSWSPYVRHARLNSDFAAVERNVITSPERNTDHDPVLVYLTARAQVGAPPGETTVQIEAPSVTYPQESTVLVRVSSGTGTPTGSVRLSLDGGPAVASTLNAGTASFELGRLGAGLHVLVATYPAQAGFASGTGVGALTVNKGIPEFAYVSAPRMSSSSSVYYTISGLLAPDGGASGKVSVSLNGYTWQAWLGSRGEFSAILGVTHPVWNTLVPGLHHVTLSYPGDANWEAASGATSVLKTALDHAVTSLCCGIRIEDDAPADPYPSTLDVSGIRGEVLDVWISFEPISHGYPSDLRVMLAGPTGVGVVLLDRVGGSDVFGPSRTLQFQRDGAPLTSSSSLHELVYAPTGPLSSADFAAPAPRGPYSGDLGVFRGLDPNGVWSLYIEDVEALHGGSVFRWTLHVVTTEGDLTWTIAGAGHFNGDGQTDLLWRNHADGSNAVWFLDNGTVTSHASLSPVPDTTWKIDGTGDFNLDGKTDILWRNGGTISAWLMDGPFVGSSSSLPSVDDLSWQIGALGDLGGDGQVDLVWRNTSDGLNALWNMSGTSVVGVQLLAGVDDLDWVIVGSGDFNQDGKADVLWRNRRSGSNAVWMMNGASVSSVAMLPAVPDLNWQIVTTGRFNADAHVDIVWRNASTGANVIWVMNGTTPASLIWLPTVDQ
jgi:predicted extracellular nuclease